MLLINPAMPGRMGMISRYSAVSLPIGIGTLAGYLLSKKRQAAILDELIHPFQETSHQLSDYIKRARKPYIFGISSLTLSIGRSFEIAQLLKKRFPDSKVILGGIHASALPDEALNTGNVDIVVRGEGEETLLLLYDIIKNGESYSGVEGISFKENGSIRHNPDRPLLQELDQIPRFPYELFDPDQYNFDFVISSRGCPYDCIFCSQRIISGRKYRFRSCEKVVEELDLLINTYHQTSISFLDDDFFVNRDRVKALTESIIAHGLNTKANFGCQARADHVTEEILEYVEAAGFTFIGLGMETGSEKLMTILNKKETVKTNIAAVQLIKRFGLHVNASFLFGIPSETHEERFKTYMLAKKLNLDFAKFNNLVPYPGTELFTIAEKEGTLNIEENWKNFNSVGGVVEGVFSRDRLPYVPSTSSEKKLRKDLVRANLYFYISNLFSLFVPEKGNPGWFLLPERWYLRPKEYYYLVKLAAKVFINCILVFDFRWLMNEILMKVGLKRWNQSEL